MNIETPKASGAASSKHVIIGASLALTISALAHGGIVNLVQDGDFEMARVPVGAFSVFPSPSSAIPDWTVGGTEVALVSSAYAEGSFVFSAQSGTQWMDLSGGAGPDRTNSITQTISTESGRQYDLSFYVGSAWDGAASGAFRPTTIDVIVNGGSRLSFTNSNVATGSMNWQLFQTTFVASSGTTVIQFLYGNAAGDTNYAVGLDTVVVTAAIPGPGALGWLFDAGFGRNPLAR